jgi:tetratricopeptide (TPR) repeat protein
VKFAFKSPGALLPWVICLLLVLAVWAVFGQTVRYDFINYDDDLYVYENPMVTGGLSFSKIVWVFTHNNGLDEWLPLTDISHMADWQLYGANAGGHHLTNVVLHAATSALLFLVLRAMTGAMWRSALVAAIFAVHPLRVESVAWVAERKDVLSGFFFMLTLWAWYRHVQKRSKIEMQHWEDALSLLDPRRWTFAYYLALICFALGLMSKNMLATLPFVLLLLDYWPLNRAPADPADGDPRLKVWLALILEKAPFFLLSALSSVITFIAQKVDVEAIQGLSVPWRLGNAVLAYVDYLAHMIYPAGLALLYPRPGMDLPVWRVVGSLLVLLVISGMVLAGRKKFPYVLVGWLWYLGMLVPVIDVMQARDQTRADRYTYLPQIGLSLLVVWGVTEFCRTWRYRQFILGGTAVVTLVGLMAAAHAQTGYWKNSISIWTRTLAITPQSSVAHCNLGIALAGQGKLDEAAEEFKQALRIQPDDAKSLDNLGKILAGQGKLAEAGERFQEALRLNPDDVKTLNNLGAILVSQGKPADAVTYLKKAVQLKPDYADADYNLGNALALQGNLDDAVQAYQQALQLKPDYAAARTNLERVRAAQAQSPGPAQDVGPTTNSNDPNVLNYWGVMLARQGRVDEAIQQFERALQINPNDASTHNNLGIALASQGKADEAYQQFTQALNLARAANNTVLADSILERLKAYEPAVLRP